MSLAERIVENGALATELVERALVPIERHIGDPDLSYRAFERIANLGLWVVASKGHDYQQASLPNGVGISMYTAVFPTVPGLPRQPMWESIISRGLDVDHFVFGFEDGGVRHIKSELKLEAQQQPIGSKSNPAYDKAVKDILGQHEWDEVERLRREAPLGWSMKPSDYELVRNAQTPPVVEAVFFETGKLREIKLQQGKRHRARVIDGILQRLILPTEEAAENYLTVSEPFVKQARKYTGDIQVKPDLFSN
jgi:hypothetical protein